jgi:hypothetical protein
MDDRYMIMQNTPNTETFINYSPDLFKLSDLFIPIIIKDDRHLIQRHKNTENKKKIRK